MEHERARKRSKGKRESNKKHEKYARKKAKIKRESAKKPKSRRNNILIRARTKSHENWTETQVMRTRIRNKNTHESKKIKNSQNSIRIEVEFALAKEIRYWLTSIFFWFDGEFIGVCQFRMKCAFFFVSYCRQKLSAHGPNDGVASIKVTRERTKKRKRSNGTKVLSTSYYYTVLLFFVRRI